jgi:uncharacterized membrane protein
VRALATVAMANGTALPPAYFRCMRAGFLLGWPAFLAVVGVFWLMLVKPALW